jgi:hypothetical protein
MFNLVENGLGAGSSSSCPATRDLAGDELLERKLGRRRTRRVDRGLLEGFFQVEPAETSTGFLAQGQQDLPVVGGVGDDQIGAEGQSPERQ